MSIFNYISQVVAYDDEELTNSPLKKVVDWKRSLLSIPVSNPKTETYDIDPNVEKLIFDGTRSTSIDNTTAFSLSNSTLDTSKYRFTWVAGTLPNFRTDRSVVLALNTVQVATLPNSLATFTALSGTPFTTVQVNDIVFIPGLTTGDGSSVFNYLNEGYWVVISVTGTVITASRLAGENFQSLAEGPVSITSNSQFQVFSNTGVQVGDKVSITGGFQANARKVYQVLSVTATRIEVLSTIPLATELSVIPGLANFTFYTEGKVFTKIEANQECAIKINNDSSEAHSIIPWLAGDKNLVGEYVRTGLTWRLSIKNKTSTNLKIVVITVE